MVTMTSGITDLSKAKQGHSSKKFQHAAETQGVDSIIFQQQENISKHRFRFLSLLFFTFDHVPLHICKDIYFTKYYNIKPVQTKLV